MIRPHTHEELTIGIVLNGNTSVTANEKAFTLNSCSMILIPKGVVHLCTPDDMNNFEYCVLHFNEEWLKTEMGIDCESLGVKKSPCDRDLIMKLINNITEESVFNLFNSGFNIIKEESTTPCDNVKIKKYIEENYKDSISLDSLSNRFNLNKYSLIRAFKKEYNISPHAYLINIRINKSKEMLLNGYSILDTAYGCGFYDQSHFIKTFKDYTGITP